MDNDNIKFEQTILIFHRAFLGLSINEKFYIDTLINFFTR